MWKNSFQGLSDFKIPRAYTKTTLSTARRKELHIFSDASVRAIAAIAYLKVIDSKGECHIGFVLGKAKLAPGAGCRCVSCGSGRIDNKRVRHQH